MDDFKLAGPTKNLKEGWKKLRNSGLLLEEPTGPQLFLGCIHERIEKTINGVKARGFSYNMESYLRETVLKYCEMLKKLLGKDVKLQTKKQAPTPSLRSFK